MMWPVMAVLGVATSVFLLISLHVRDWNRSGGGEFQDSDTLRQELAKWSPLVYDRCETIRAVKRFMNRARFLTAGECDEKVGPLVALLALEEADIVAAWSIDVTFDQWKQQDWWRLVRPPLAASRVAEVEKWIETTTDDHRQHYQVLVTGRKR